MTGNRRGKKWLGVGVNDRNRFGSEHTLLKLLNKLPAQEQGLCSLYFREENDVHLVSEDVLLTNWKSQSSIIGLVDLQPVPGKCGRYALHPASKESLLRLGILRYDVSNPHPVTDDDSHGCTSSRKDDEFYEVEQVIGRRLSKDALCYEYKVRFKGYGSEEDMWLPASFFNGPIQFESTSKFGRKRKHTLDPENVIEDNRRWRHSGSDQGGPNTFEYGNRVNRSKKMKPNSEQLPQWHQMNTKSQFLQIKPVSHLREEERKSGLDRDKGKLFQSSLDTNRSPCKNGASDKELCQLPEKVIKKTLNLRKWE